MHCSTEMSGSACFCLLPLLMERRCVMNIFNWRDHADAFLDNNMLVMSVVVGGILFVWLFTSIFCGPDHPRDRHRPH